MLINRIIRSFQVIFLMLIACEITAQSGLGRSPLNPDYLKFLEELDTPVQEGIELMAAPAPIQLNFGQYFEDKIDQSPKNYPVAYDLRTAGPGGTSLLTSVKNQLNCGACWAFATYGSIESVWKRMGLGDNDFSENNLKNCSGFDLNPCVWGHHFMSTAYLIRGSGPINETSDPYNPVNPNCTQGLEPMAYIPISRYLPEDHDAFKEAIMSTGPVYNTFRSTTGGYQWINGHYTFCYQGSGTTSHAIAIVGWNDTLSTACGHGAWLAKNEYGTGFGEGGFFYISYKDTLVLKYNAIWPEREDYDAGLNIYQYDIIGGWPSVGYNNPVAYGLVKFLATGDQYVTKIGTYTVSFGSYLSAEIYSDFDGSTLTGLLAEIPEQYCDYPGFWQLDLPASLTVYNGEDFYVKVKYYSPGEVFPIAIETTEAGYTIPVIETGKCWTSPDESIWEPAGIGTPNEFDLCIKAFSYDLTKVDLKVYLEGPFNGLSMNSDLYGIGDFPLNQPFSGLPWNYEGTESLPALLPDMVDWVLIELRETSGSASTAIGSTRIARQAAILMNDGAILSTDGILLPEFQIHVRNNLYAILYHRNHLGIMSAVPVTKNNGFYEYDFSTGMNKAYNNGQKLLGGGIYGMKGGDGESNGSVSDSDKTLIWRPNAGKRGYEAGDYDLNSQVSNPDKNDIWKPNQGSSSQIPE